MTNPETPRPRPERVNGVAHFFAAAGYSLAGLKRLWREAAFRHEVLAACLLFILLYFVGASLQEFVVMAVLVLMTIVVEALNTAIECIVDYISPDWSEPAKHAKDLGSLAVMCMLIATGLYAGITVCSIIFQ